MGCDIHAHVELKINGQWHHYDQPRIQRDYKLFARMANVRNEDGITPISEPRGLPDDITFIVKFDSDHCGSDGHSHSYLTSEEMAELDRECQNSDSYADWVTFGYLFGGHYCYYFDYPDERTEGVEDFRLVFWFDN